MIILLLSLFLYTTPLSNCRTVDGDTIECDIQVGYKISIRDKIRFTRINTPERGEKGYQEAKDYVHNRTSNCTNLYIKSSGYDKYGRILGEVYCEDSSINQELLDKGLAKEFVFHKPKRGSK